MKFDICKTLILAVVILGAGCGNLTEPNSFSFATLTGVPLNTPVQSNVVTIKGNQFAAPITFANMSSAAYATEVNINNTGFTTVSGQLLSPGTTLQLQQTTASTANTARTSAITVGGFTATFTTVTSINGGINTASDASGNTVTISSIAAALVTGTNVVNYTITADAGFNTTNTTGSTSSIPVTFTLQAISNTGSVIYSTTANVSIPFTGSSGQSGFPLFSGSLPTKVSGTLPNAINGYPITSVNYWNSLIAYWQIAPNSLTLQQ